MFYRHQDKQFALFQQSVEYFHKTPERLVSIERFVCSEILHFISLKLPEIRRDYDEASFLHPFWMNYPPEDRGRAPIGNQCPWIEVGEQVFGNKLARYFAANFSVKDAGLPSGADDRCIISSERIREILKITDSVWVFIDIKSAGPTDNFPHVVLSPYQVSGEGVWSAVSDGIRNSPIIARGERATHNFHCSLSPLYVLSDGTVAPLVTVVIKPIYELIEINGEPHGQPLKGIKIISIPNGILLTRDGGYIQRYPGLFFPGKDDKKKDPRKVRARISFEILKLIDAWRVCEIPFGGSPC